jgi:hypothetical protein
MIARESRLAAARRQAALRTEAGDGPPRSEALISNLCASAFVPESANLVNKRHSALISTSISCGRT